MKKVYSIVKTLTVLAGMVFGGTGLLAMICVIITALTMDRPDSPVADFFVSVCVRSGRLFLLLTPFTIALWLLQHQVKSRN